MSELEIVVTSSRRLEGVLRRRFKAQGKGLHSLVSSVQHQLPKSAVRGLRYVATLRNKVVHDEGFRLRSVPDFEKEVARIERLLAKTAPGRATGWLYLALTVAVAGAAYWLS